MRSFNHEILLLEEGNLSFSQRIGTQIDGILGASLFEDYKITVNYNTERLRIERSQEKKIHPESVVFCLFALGIVNR